MKTKDLNLLKIFFLLLEERNLSRVAKSVRLTQPAISRALNRLREEFHDPLFIRRPGGMLPTAKALSLEQPLREALEKVEGLYTKPATFNPSLAKGIVRIATTDYFEQVVWVEIAGIIHRTAPGLQLVTQMTGSQIPMEAMRDGTIQLAIAGFFKELPAGFMRQSIFSDRFVSIVRRGHPEVKKQLSLDLYLKQSHLIISPQGVLEGAVDLALAKKHKKRHVAASVCSFLSSGPLVAASDLVLTAPEKVAERFAAYLPIKTFEPPLTLPAINVVQVWHERFHHDPMLSWLRSIIFESCKKLQAL